MNRHLIALIAVITYLLLALVLRPALLRWRTGRWGFNGLSGEAGSAGWWGGISFSASLLAIPLALALDPMRLPEFLIVPALMLMGAGLAITILAQSGMGTSWRIGVDATERTTLVTTGLFAFVRNPIFTGMGTFAVGFVLLWPNPASLASLGLLALGVELQVRFVEEPYLKTVHGGAWLSWAQRVGRFIPCVGRE